jgi:hypothetical protein
MGEMMMKIGATKPVMKDTSPILKGVLEARRRFVKRGIRVYYGSIYRDMYREENRGWN